MGFLRGISALTLLDKLPTRKDQGTHSRSSRYVSDVAEKKNRELDSSDNTN